MLSGRGGLFVPLPHPKFGIEDGRCSKPTLQSNDLSDSSNWLVGRGNASMFGLLGLRFGPAEGCMNGIK